MACAIALQNAMVDFNTEQRRLGLPELDLGIGLTTEAAIVGHLGSDHQTKYGAIGPALKLAAEMASVAASGQILIDATLYGRLRNQLELRRLVQGVSREPASFDRLYEISGLDGPYQMALQNRSCDRAGS